MSNLIQFLRPARDFASALLASLRRRLPDSGTKEPFYCFGHYLDPYSRGILLEKKFFNLNETKKALNEIFGGLSLDSRNNNSDDPAPDRTDQDDPLEMFLVQRSVDNYEQNEELTQLELEMQKYESLPKVPKDVDVLKWWYSQSAELPIMYKIARHFLGVPVSSSGSERTFSTSGRIDTPQRRRLTPKHIEQLTVMKESRQVVESIKKAYSIKESNQKVDFSDLVIIKEVLRNLSLEEMEEEGNSWDDLDSSEEEEEAVSDTD